MRGAANLPTTIGNERIKALSGMVFNLATALLITIVVRVYGNGGFDWTAIGWSIVDGLLIFGAYKSLLMLESEE